LKEVEFQLSSVKKVIVGGSKLSEDLAQRIERVIGAELVNAYGSTEAGWVSSRVGHFLDPSNLGEITNGVTVKIFDEEFKEIETSESGLIGVKSHQCVSGYFQDDAQTQKQFKDGWFFSGDIGRIINGNQLFLDGRLDERINSGGVKIDPSVIENFIIGKFSVSDAGGFSLPGEKGIEMFGLAVVSETELNLEEIFRILKE
jgi:long-chain acyl-CoA synthetase